MTAAPEVTRAFGQFLLELFAARPPELEGLNTREELGLRIQQMERAVDAFRAYLAAVVCDTQSHFDNTDKLAAEADIRIQEAWAAIRYELRCAIGDGLTSAPRRCQPDDAPPPDEAPPPVVSAPASIPPDSFEVFDPPQAMPAA